MVVYAQCVAPDGRKAYAFQTCGIEVRVATTVDDALTKLEDFVPHVIVFDIGMPGEEGYSLIRRISTGI